MNIKVKQFLSELSDLMEKHEAEIYVTEGGSNYQVWAEGIEVCIGRGSIDIDATYIDADRIKKAIESETK